MEHNPWLTVWTKPRDTISKIARENPNRSIWWLSAIYGFCSLMNIFQSMALGSAMSPWLIVLLAIVISPIWGYINISILAAFVTWVGKLFKGQGNFKTVRTSYAWSNVPIALNIPLWLLMVIVFGHQLFLNFPDAHLLTTGYLAFLFTVFIVKLVLSVWSLVIFINGLAEVQKFSILKAIGNIVIAGVVLGVLFGLLWFGFIYLAVGGGDTSTAAFFFDGTLEILGNL